ncbi:hypothetical protein ACSNN7_07180 [Micromonospora sp. URMC 105]|uniref:hypothetical protein n=1 Tax=Micromonospora sp. URMC 105 TaxID=3423413 RepID=UPI003F1DBED1
MAAQIDADGAEVPGHRDAIPEMTVLGDAVDRDKEGPGPIDVMGEGRSGAFSRSPPTIRAGRGGEQ